MTESMNIDLYSSLNYSYVQIIRNDKLLFFLVINSFIFIFNYIFNSL